MRKAASPILVILVLILAAALAPSRAMAGSRLGPDFDRLVNNNDFKYNIRGIGTDHFFSTNFGYHPNVYFNDESGELEQRGSGVVEIQMAFIMLPTIFGTLGGLEGDVTIGTPLFNSYLGGLGGDIGIVLQPLSTRRLRASVALGTGFRAHSYAYLKPRVALSLVPGTVDAELSFRWIPSYTSHVFGGGEGGLEEPGFGEQRLRMSVFIRVGKVQGRDFMASAPNLHLFAERVAVSGDADQLEVHSMRAGAYWGGGVGMAY